MKFILHRTVSVMTGERSLGHYGNWQLVTPHIGEDFDALVSYYQNMNTEPDPMRREVRVFETPDDVDWESIQAALTK